MKVILLEDVKTLGKAGDIVKVKDGYARNYLIPKNLVMVANAVNLKRLDYVKKQQEERDAASLEKAQDMKNKIEQVTVSLQVKAGENGKIFGSVTSMDLAEELSKQGLDIDKKNIVLEHAIKEIGEHKVPIKLHSEVKAELDVIISEETEQE